MKIARVKTMSRVKKVFLSILSFLSFGLMAKEMDRRIEKVKAEHAAGLQRIREEYEAKISDTTEAVREIVERDSHVEVNRLLMPPRYYRICYNFDAHLIDYGACSGHQKEIIVNRAADMIKYKMMQAVFVRPPEE